MVQLTQNHPYVTLRLKFKKVGNLQYVSHLDLVRTMHKIVVRAGLPLWYTEGFNPKPKMIFAAPLSIGTESIAEYMDVKLIDDIPPEEAMRRLNENMTDEIQVLEAYYTEEKLTNLKWLSYRMTVTTRGASEALAERVREVLGSDSIMVEKKAPKKGETPKTFDIAPLIKQYSVEYDQERASLVVDATLSADASTFLNPEYVIKALKKYAGILSSGDLLAEHYSIMRLAAYNEDMTPFR